MLVEKILLGVTLAAPIGPVSLEMIQRGLSQGFWSAFVVRLGGVLGNLLCLLLATWGIGYLVQSPKWMNTSAFIGSVILIYLGVKAIKRARSFQQLSPSSISKIYSHLNGFFTGLVVSIANPVAVVFWVSIFTASFDASQTAGFFVRFYQNIAILLGVLLWGALLSGFLELGKRYFNHRVVQGITFLAGSMLIYFGLKYGSRAFLALSL